MSIHGSTPSNEPLQTGKVSPSWTPPTTQPKEAISDGRVQSAAGQVFEGGKRLIIGQKRPSLQERKVLPSQGEPSIRSLATLLQPQAQRASMMSELQHEEKVARMQRTHTEVQQINGHLTSAKPQETVPYTFRGKEYKISRVFQGDVHRGVMIEGKRCVSLDDYLGKLEESGVSHENIERMTHFANQILAANIVIPIVQKNYSISTEHGQESHSWNIVPTPPTASLEFKVEYNLTTPPPEPKILGKVQGLIIIPDIGNKDPSKTDYIQQITYPFKQP
jgi:hypothetical protein